MTVGAFASRPSRRNILHTVSSSLKATFIFAVCSSAAFPHLSKNTTELEEYLSKGNKDKCTGTEFQNSEL